jgi:hypothetical protein
MRPRMAAHINKWRSVMFTTALGLRGQAQRKGWIPTKTVRVAALLGALVLMSITVNALIVVADGTVRQRSSASEDCPAITQKVERLTCFDNLAQRPAPHPFKGANAPALSGSL